MSEKTRHQAGAAGDAAEAGRGRVRIIPAEAAGEAFARWAVTPKPERRRAPERAGGDSPAGVGQREYAGFRKPQHSGGGAGMPTAADIEALQQQAWDEGYRAGEQAGREAGYTEGHREGMAAGHREGHAAGYQAGEQAARELVRHMEGLVHQLDRPLEQMDQEVEQALAELAMHLARQVIYRELRIQPGEIVRLIREAVGLLPVGARNVEVHLHPEDARFIRETLSADGESEQAWRLVEDPAISRGGCRVSTETSHIDATLEHRLAQLAQQVLGNGREVGSDKGQATGRDGEDGDHG